MTTQTWLSELVDWSARLMARSVDFQPTQTLQSHDAGNAGAQCGSMRAFQLVAWPELPQEFKTADVYRALSLMSTRPVNLLWLQSRARLTSEQARQLLVLLFDLHAVQMVESRSPMDD